MALFPQCIICRFLDDLAEKDVKEKTRLIISAFFKSTGAQSVRCVQETYSIEEAVEKLSEQVARTEPSPGTSPELLAQIDRQIKKNVTSEGVKVAKLSGGISFRMDDCLNSNSRWDFHLHHGPLPMLDLRTSHGEGFQPAQAWAETFFSSGAAHFLWLDGKYGIGRKKCYGTGDNQYLISKRDEIFLFSKGDSSEDSVQAGLDLRRLCHDVWEQHGQAIGDMTPFTSWSWRKKRLIKAFDKALVDEVGAEKLDELLKAMGTTVEQWLNAGD
jgi:hypothetical protein